MKLASDFGCSATRNLDHLELEFFAAIILGQTKGFGMERSKFTDAQKAFVVKQGEEGTPVAEIVYVGPQPHHLEGCSFKGGFGGSGSGTNARTTSPPATVSLY